jgi:hypothetical protein
MIKFEIEIISKNAAHQLDIEITFIKKALIKYESKESLLILSNFQEYLIKVSSFDPDSLKYVNIKNDIIKDFTQKTKLQLDCFHIQNDSLNSQSKNNN